MIAMITDGSIGLVVKNLEFAQVEILLHDINGNKILKIGEIVQVIEE